MSGFVLRAWGIVIAIGALVAMVGDQDFGFWIVSALVLISYSILEGK